MEIFEKKKRTDDLMSVSAILLVFSGILFATLRKLMFRVPANHVSVIYRSGRTNPVIVHQGWNIYWWPLETIHSVHWECTKESENNGPFVKHVYHSNFIPITPQQLDVVPIQVMTKDRVSVHVNGTLHYKIEDVVSVVNSVPNLLLNLEDCVFSGCRIAISKINHSDLLGKDSEIASDILQHVNEQLKYSGVSCSEFKIQDIELNETLMETHEKSITQQQQLQFEIESAEQQAQTEIRKNQIEEEKTESKRKRELNEAEGESNKKKRLAELNHEEEMQLLEDAAQKNQREIQIYTERQMNELVLVGKQLEKRLENAKKEAEIARVEEESKLIKTRLELEYKTQQLCQLLQAGFDSDQIVSMENAPHIAASLANTQKFVISNGEIPWNIFSAPSSEAVQLHHHTGSSAK